MQFKILKSLKKKLIDKFEKQNKIFLNSFGHCYIKISDTL